MPQERMRCHCVKTSPLAIPAKEEKQTRGKPLVQEGLHSLSVEDELFTAEVEDDYDALNDETFGGGLDDGWEEAHEKFAELEDRARQDSSMVDLLVDEDPLLLNQEVVEQSISHLGLEDDRDDDPAIKSYSEFTTYGSPKTDTIWTPKAVYPSSTEDRLTSLLWKLQQQSSSTQVLSQVSSLQGLNISELVQC
ncbi:hypothetical protein HPB51_006584 [Rhipicephalus microplus]|uniref:Uncharacterized protein n=1 Tax=Rhipicephalus microplus TaxID=6941 RepID=A0A9J6E7Q4_RHIMP|nr:hypothetical protein HPB51_006584 [Rhipicephalus microplus]